MRKRKVILIIMLILFLFCLLGVVFYLVREENGGRDPVETTLNASEASERLESEYSELNKILINGMNSSWLNERPDHFNLPYAISRAEGEVGYLQIDLDGDGSDELLVGEMLDIGFTIFGLYSGTVNGELDPVLLSEGYTGWVLLKDGILIAEESYRIRTTEYPDFSVEGEEETESGEITENEETEPEVPKNVAYLYRDGELLECDIPDSIELMELPEYTPAGNRQD